MGDILQNEKDKLRRQKKKLRAEMTTLESLRGRLQSDIESLRAEKINLAEENDRMFNAKLSDAQHRRTQMRDRFSDRLKKDIDTLDAEGQLNASMQERELERDRA